VDVTITSPKLGIKNPWVKVSYQYVYFYLGWLLHHVDRIDQYVYKYSYWQVRKSESCVSDYLRARKNQTLVLKGNVATTLETRLDAKVINFVDFVVSAPRYLYNILLSEVTKMTKKR